MKSKDDDADRVCKKVRLNDSIDFRWIDDDRDITQVSPFVEHPNQVEFVGGYQLSEYFASLVVVVDDDQGSRGKKVGEGEADVDKDDDQSFS
jgi:hypothetical protein